MEERRSMPMKTPPPLALLAAKLNHGFEFSNEKSEMM
jgi:hypothetical protein